MRLNRFSFPIGLLDARTALIERLWEEDGLVLDVGAIGDHWADAPSNAPLGGCSWRHIPCRPWRREGGYRARRPTGSGTEDCRWLRRTVSSNTSGRPRKSSLQMDLGGETALGAPERLARLPPFAPAAETWARTTVLSNICTRCAVGLCSASIWKKASNTPALLSRQNRFHYDCSTCRTPSAARVQVTFVDRLKLVKRLKKEPIVAPLVASPGPRRPKHLQRNAPVRLAHPCQHGRPPNRPPMNQPCATLTTQDAMPESIRPHSLHLLWSGPALRQVEKGRHRRRRRLGRRGGAHHRPDP